MQCNIIFMYSPMLVNTTTYVHVCAWQAENSNYQSYMQYMFMQYYIVRKYMYLYV